MALVFSAFVLAQSPVNLPQFTPDPNGTINLVCQINRGVGLPDEGSILFMSLNREAGTVVLREGTRQSTPIPMQLTGEDLTFSIPTSQSSLSYSIKWEDMIIYRDVLFGGAVFPQVGNCGENTARQVAAAPAQPVAPAPVPAPATTATSAAPPSANGRTLMHEFGPGGAGRRSRLERVPDPSGVSADAWVATFILGNRSASLELICLQRPRQHVFVRYTTDPSSEWTMHTNNEGWSNVVEVSSSTMSRADFPQEWLWTYSPTGAILADPAQVTAIARSLAAGGRTQIDFIRQYSGPRLVSPEGRAFGGTRFPQGMAIARVTDGRPAVQAVFEACGYPVAGL